MGKIIIYILLLFTGKFSQAQDKYIILATGFLLDTVEVKHNREVIFRDILVTDSRNSGMAQVIKIKAGKTEVENKVRININSNVSMLLDIEALNKKQAIEIHRRPTSKNYPDNSEMIEYLNRLPIHGDSWFKLDIVKRNKKFYETFLKYKPMKIIDITLRR